MSQGQYRTEMSVPLQGFQWLKEEAARYFTQPMGILRIYLIEEFDRHGDLSHIEDTISCDTTMRIKLPRALVDHIGGTERTRAAIRHIIAREAGLLSSHPRQETRSNRSVLAVQAA